MTVRQHRLSVPAYPSDYIYPADKDYPLNEDWEGGPVALLDTSLGLNNQAWRLTYDPTPPPAYDPAMQQFDGATGVYSQTTFTTTGNQVTAVFRFNRSSFTGGGIERLFMVLGPLGNIRAMALFFASDHANANRADKILVQTLDNAGGQLCRLVTPAGYIDGTEHVGFYSFDGDAGTSTFFIDETNADDAGNPDRIGPTVGTLDSGSGGLTAAYLGSDLTNFYAGLAGYFGYRDAYLTNYTDFMDGNKPRQLNEITWTQWGAQPLFWKDTGAMDASIGVEVMIKNGTITEVPPPGGFQSFTVTPEDTGDPVVVLSGVDSVQCALAFDQNGHVTIAWIDSNDGSHLYWYDTTVGNWIISDFDVPVGGVGLTLDDKRNEQTGASDILLWYTLPIDGHYEIYTREQRDRFDTPYPMSPGVPVWPYFKKLGMADELRVQMTMTNVGPP